MNGTLVVSADSRRFLQKLIDYAQPEDFDRALVALREGMQATDRVRMMQRDKNGNLQYEDVPNHRIRLLAAGLFLEYAFVKPSAAVANVQPGAPNDHKQDAERFAEALMKDWERMKAIGDDYARRIDRARPVEIESRPMERDSGKAERATGDQSG